MLGALHDVGDTNILHLGEGALDTTLATGRHAASSYPANFGTLAPDLIRPMGP